MTKKINVLLITPDGSLCYHSIDNTLSALQHLVGGNITTIYDPHCIAGNAYCNVAGFFNGMKINKVAGMYLGKMVHGPVVLLSIDEYGNRSSIRIEQIKGVLNTVFGLPVEYRDDIPRSLSQAEIDGLYKNWRQGKDGF